MSKFLAAIAAMGAFLSFVSCAANQPRVETTARIAASAPQEPHRSINLSDLPDRLDEFDQAIAGLKKENSEIKKRLTALESENFELKKQVSGGVR